MKKNESIDTNIDPEDILKDADKLFNFIDEFTKVDYLTADLDKLEKRANSIQDIFKNKYKKYMIDDFDEKREQEIKDNLDTEE